jgi:GT2 family glycosyltransferase
MDLSVIIVSWNVAGDLLECLTSLFSSTDRLSKEVLVVDNASTDGTTALVRRCFPDVRLLENLTNVGFPRANNQALEICSGDCVLLLNPDTVVSPSVFDTCVAFMRGHSDVGMLGCRLLYPDGRIQYECARNFPSLLALVWESVYLDRAFPRSPLFGCSLMRHWDHLDSREVPCISGAFMLVRRECLARIGPMDETVPMYLEDIDWCYRVWHSGYKVYYLSSVGIIHKTGRSTANTSSRFQRVLLGSDALHEFYRKHRGRSAAALCRVLLLWTGLVRLALSIPLWPIGRVFDRAKNWGYAYDPAFQCARLRWAFVGRRNSGHRDTP